MFSPSVAMSDGPAISACLLLVVVHRARAPMALPVCNLRIRLRFVRVVDVQSAFLLPVRRPAHLRQADRIIPRGGFAQAEMRHEPLLQPEDERTAWQARYAAVCPGDFRDWKFEETFGAVGEKL